jgi:GDP-L-fucose synthase
MRILVAGKTGLVGSAIVYNLQKKYNNVVGISTQDVDLLDRSKTFEYIQRIKPDVIINAAARVGGIGANNNSPVEFLTQNLQIQNNLIDAAFQADVAKVIFLGSSCIYPKNAPQPIKETELLNGYLEPTNSAYAIAKIAGIELIKAYRKEYDKKWISLMPANLYGPRDNFNVETGHVLPSLIHKFYRASVKKEEFVELWGNGSALREFLHVDDLADAVIFCMNYYDGEQHMNIGSGEEMSIKDLANLIAEKLHFKGEIRWNSNMPNGTPRKILDSTKIQNLGWKPKIDLDDGLDSTIRWFIKNSTSRI